MNRPTEEQIQKAHDRYKRHMKAVSGRQTMDAFFDSPYMVCPGRGQAWHWAEDMMRIDCVILAEAYVHENL